MSQAIDLLVKDLQKALADYQTNASYEEAAKADPVVTAQAEKPKLFYTTKEVAEQLGVDRRKISWLRKYGLLKGMNMGKQYCFSEDAIRVFSKKYAGYDLSNEESIATAAALNAMRARNRK